MNARRRAWRHWIAPALLAALTLGPAVRAAANPLTVAVGVGLSEQYNDNIFFSTQKEDDYITILGLRLNLGYKTQSSTTTLNTGIAGSYFASGGIDLNLAGAQNLSYSTSYQYSSRLSFTFNDRLVRLNSSARTLFDINAQATGTTTTETAAQDPAGVNPNDVNILLPHGNAFTNSFGVGASYFLTPLWTGGLTYTNGVSNFSDPSSTDLTQSVGLQLSYQWSPPLSLSGGYSYSRFHASNAADSNGHSAAVGAGYQFAPLWSAFGSVGVSLNRPVGSSSGSTNPNATFSVGLDRAFERSSLSFGAQQGLTPSAGVAGTSLTLGAYISYAIQLTEYLSGTLNTSYTHFDTSSGNFSAYQLYAGLSYPVWRQISAGLGYAYRRSDSNQAIANTLAAGVVDGNVVSIHIGTTFQLWQLDV